MNFIDFEFARYHVTAYHKDILLQYHDWLKQVEPAQQEKLIAIHLSEQQGAMITSMLVLAMVDVENFLRFGTYTHDVAYDAADAVEANVFQIPGKTNASEIAKNLRKLSAMLRTTSLNVVATKTGEHTATWDILAEHVLDYVAILMKFLELYRYCEQPYTDTDDYDDSWIRKWMVTCSVPIVKISATSKLCLH